MICDFSSKLFLSYFLMVALCFKMQNYNYF